MTPTKTAGNGTMKVVIAVIATIVSVGGAGYALLSDRITDRCEPIAHEVEHNAERISVCEETSIEMRERLARIETKLDALLARDQP